MSSSSSSSSPGVVAPGARIIDECYFVSTIEDDLFFDNVVDQVDYP